MFASYAQPSGVRARQREETSTTLDSRFSAESLGSASTRSSDSSHTDTHNSAELKQAKFEPIGNTMSEPVPVPLSHLAPFVTNHRSSLLPSATDDRSVLPTFRATMAGEVSRSESLAGDGESEVDPNLLNCPAESSRRSWSGPSERTGNLTTTQLMASLKLDESRMQQAMRWVMAPQDQQALLSYGLSLKIDQALSSQRAAPGGSSYAVPIELTHHIERLLYPIFLNPRLLDYTGSVKQCLVKAIGFGKAKDQLPFEYKLEGAVQNKIDSVIDYHLAYNKRDICRMLGKAKDGGWSTPKLCRKMLKLCRGENLQHTQEFWVRWAFLRFMFQQVNSGHFWKDVNAKLAERQRKFDEQNVEYEDQVNFYVSSYYRVDQKKYPHEKLLTHMLVDWRQLNGIQANLWNIQI